MNIEQISIKYIALEDRLLISVNTSESQQYNYFMTRNITKQVLPLLHKYFEVEQLKMSSAASESDKKTVQKMQHQKMLEDVEFAGGEDTSDEEIKERLEQLEVKPTLLLQQVAISPMESEKVLLVLSPEDSDKGLQFAMTMKFLHSLYQLFINAVKKADWDFADSLLSIDANEEFSTQDELPEVDAKKLN